MMDFPVQFPPNTGLATIDPVKGPQLARQEIHMDCLRLDKIHPVISGNKWFKLQHYLQKAAGPPPHQILTFGGAWSNHIIAAAYASRLAGLPAIGIIRGERPPVLSTTLQAASSYGMQLEFISREEYDQKDQPSFGEQLLQRYPGACIIPEGGAGPEGVEGCRSILEGIDYHSYSHILCAIGTGTMYRGLSQVLRPEQTLIGVPVLKGFTDLSALHRPGLPEENPSPFRKLASDYHFGGYAKKTPPLLAFMNQLYQVTGIPTDFVYTGKLFFAAMDMVQKDLFPAGSRLLLIHSGGLQGNSSLTKGELVF